MLRMSSWHVLLTCLFLKLPTGGELFGNPLLIYSALVVQWTHKGRNKSHSVARGALSSIVGEGVLAEVRMHPSKFEGGGSKRLA